MNRIKTISIILILLFCMIWISGCTQQKPYIYTNSPDYTKSNIQIISQFDKKTISICCPPVYQLEIRGKIKNTEKTVLNNIDVSAVFYDKSGNEIGLVSPDSIDRLSPGEEHDFLVLNLGDARDIVKYTLGVRYT